DSGKRPPAEGMAVVQRVAEHYGRGGPSEKIGGLLETLSQHVSPAVTPIIAGLSRGWPKDKTVKLSEADEKAIVTLMSKLPSERGSLVALARRLGTDSLDASSAELAKSLLVQIQDAKADEAKRLELAKELIDLRPADTEVAVQLLDLVGPRSSPEFAAGMLEKIGHSESKELGASLASRVGSMTPQLRAGAIHQLVSRSDWTGALLDALQDGKISLADLPLDQKQALATAPNREIARRAGELLFRAGSLPNADRQKVVDEFMPMLEKSGDPDAGKVVFTKQCAKCHTHAGAGAEGKVGPDLSGMAVHPKKDLLIDILDPSRSVEGTFRAYTLVTDDARTIVGLLGSESKTSVEIVDSEAKRHTVLRENIESLTPSPKSLMPEGFEKQVSKDDIVNLLAFLTQRGRYMPIPIAKAASVVTTKNMFSRDDKANEKIVFDSWSPKTVNGVQFRLIDPQGDRVPNAIMLFGEKAPQMPKMVEIPCNMPAKAIHMLSGVAGWGFPSTEAKTLAMTLRLHYADGQTEDHELKNGVEFADYRGNTNVPGSKPAFRLGEAQLRYLSIEPKRGETIERIELIKGGDNHDPIAPIVMAITVETPTQPTGGTSPANNSEANRGASD
ncbi:MAG TPA: c-type cytochrome, partial [Pirellulales bacterium]